MSALQTIPKRPVRAYRAPEFKSQLVKLALEPGASVSGVAVAHSVNPNLLRRWVKESGALVTPPTFVPVRIESGVDRHVHTPASNGQRVEVNTCLMKRWMATQPRLSKKSWTSCPSRTR
jgi:transposase-like protein